MTGIESTHGLHAAAARRPGRRARPRPGGSRLRRHGRRAAAARAHHLARGRGARRELQHASPQLLQVLAADDPEKDITLYINSPGGSISAGMVIYDTMQLIPNDVATVAMGLAASMGQFLLTAGAAGQALRHRRHARIMMHQPLGRHRRHGVGHQDPGRADAVHQEADGRADRRAHRPDARADRAGLRPRPLVHRGRRPREYGIIDQVMPPPARDRTSRSEHVSIWTPDRRATWHARPRATSCRSSGSAPRTASASTTRTRSCSRSASSSSACRSTTRRPTTSWRSCCAWSRWTPTATSRSTSTPPAARTRR